MRRWATDALLRCIDEGSGERVEIESATVTLFEIVKKDVGRRVVCDRFHSAIIVVASLHRQADGRPQRCLVP